MNEDVVQRFHRILCDRINELCEEKGQSHYKLSYNSAVPMTTLKHIMRGKTLNPGVLTMMRICDGLGVSMQEFFDTKEFNEFIEDLRDEK